MGDAAFEALNLSLLLLNGAGLLAIVILERVDHSLDKMKDVRGEEAKWHTRAEMRWGQDLVGG